MFMNTLVVFFAPNKFYIWIQRDRILCISLFICVGACFLVNHNRPLSSAISWHHCQRFKLVRILFAVNRNLLIPAFVLKGIKGIWMSRNTCECVRIQNVEQYVRKNLYQFKRMCWTERNNIFSQRRHTFTKEKHFSECIVFFILCWDGQQCTHKSLKNN